MISRQYHSDSSPGDGDIAELCGPSARDIAAISRRRPRQYHGDISARRADVAVISRRRRRYHEPASRRQRILPPWHRRRVCRLHVEFLCGRRPIRRPSGRTRRNPHRLSSRPSISLLCPACQIQQISSIQLSDSAPRLPHKQMRATAQPLLTWGRDRLPIATSLQPGDRCIQYALPSGSRQPNTPRFRAHRRSVHFACKGH